MRDIDTFRVKPYNLCMILLILAILLIGPDGPPDTDLSHLSEFEQEHIFEANAEALEKHLEDWAAGQGVEPFEVTVDPTWYDPDQGGINCGGDCRFTANGSPTNDCEDCTACPPDLPFGTEIQLYGTDWECVDRGDSIVMRDGVVRLDLLVTGGVERLQQRATITLPPPVIVCPTCTKPISVPDLQFAPLLSNIDLPPAECPVWSCDPWYVKIQGISEDHGGVDLWAGEDGGVYASWVGEIVHVGEGENKALGKTVVINYRRGFWSLLAHVTPVVRVGQIVEAGQLLGHADNSGLTLDKGHTHLKFCFGLHCYDILDVIEVTTLIAPARPALIPVLYDSEYKWESAYATVEPVVEPEATTAPVYMALDELQ